MSVRASWRTLQWPRTVKRDDETKLPRLVTEGTATAASRFRVQHRRRSWTMYEAA